MSEIPYELISLAPDSRGMSRDGRAIALGMFDGVHAGHREILRRTLEFSDFWPAATTFRKPAPKVAGNLLTTFPERLRLLADEGIREVIALDFEDVVDTEPGDFVAMLRQELGAQALVCGQDHRFGKGRAGDAQFLREHASCQVDVVPPYVDPHTGQWASSSSLRSRVIAGEVWGFPVLSRVATGSQLGRELGYPTLNLPYPAEKVKPPNGVYAAFTDGYASAVNLGVAPTMGRGSTPILESHLLEVPEPVPRLGDEVWVELMEFIRPERRFDGVDALREQIGRDCEKIREILQLQVRDPSRASRLNWFESK